MKIFLRNKVIKKKIFTLTDFFFLRVNIILRTFFYGFGKFLALPGSETLVHGEVILQQHVSKHFFP